MFTYSIYKGEFVHCSTLNGKPEINNLRIKCLKPQ